MKNRNMFMEFTRTPTIPSGTVELGRSPTPSGSGSLQTPTGNSYTQLHNSSNSVRVCDIHQSPFANLGTCSGSGGSTSVVLYLEPIMNSYYKNYQNIITLNAMPAGPIQDMVVPMSMPKLSEFQSASAFSSYQSNNQCTFVLLRYPKNSSSSYSSVKTFKNSDAFMGADDIPAVLSYLQSNGYTIDTSITKMLFKSRAVIGGVAESRMSGDRKMICMVSYNG